MDQRDREAIETLFDRLADAERRDDDRDREAEALIQQAIRRRPASPYYMAQTIVVQQQALENAQRRIEELESAGRGSGLFSGLFGGGDRNPRGANRAMEPQQQPGAGPWNDRRNAGGGSFLGGAAQTAVGVAGGVLLGGLISNALFGGGSASAAEEPAAPEELDAGGDAGDFDGGFDF